MTIIFVGCDKDSVEHDLANKKNKQIAVFDPAVNYTLVNGVLSFESKADFDKVLSQIWLEELESVAIWEKQIGFQSLKSYFESIISAEEEVERKVLSLPVEEQKTYLNSPQIHSTVYKEAISKGIIKEVVDSEDGSEYWDYAMTDPSCAPLLSKDGLVMIEGKLVYFTNTRFVKVIKNGDFDKLSEIENINKNFEDDQFFVYDLVNQPVNNHKIECASNSFTKTNNWQYPTSKKRVKAWVDGSSSVYLYSTSPCNGYRGQTVTFMLRLEAQKKNFWGKWKYTSYYPSAYIDDADWDYTHSYYDSNCSGSYTEYGDILNNNFPKPLWDEYYPTVNNAFLKMNPHTDGWWPTPSNGYKYIHCVVDMDSYNIPVSFGGYGASVWNLTR